MRLEAYDRGGFHDEMFDDAGSVRPEARMLLETIESLDEGQLLRCQRSAERPLLLDRARPQAAHPRPQRLH